MLVKQEMLITYVNTAQWVHLVQTELNVAAALLHKHHWEDLVVETIVLILIVSASLLYCERDLCDINLICTKSNVSDQYSGYT